MLISLAACNRDDPAPRTIAVPGDFTTIQAAIDAASPGDLVLVDAGTYPEDVVVHVNDLTVRGRDRNAVVIDGEFERNNGVVIAADGVALENLTVARHTDNGVLVSASYTDAAGDPEVERFRISYVTAANNGLYGVYAFGVRDGTIEHSYASGTAGAGYYVGQCKPCNIVLRSVTAEQNTLGYQGANASDVYVVESTFRANRIGLITLSETVEDLSPQRGATFAANLVVDNDSVDAPAGVEAQFGVGVVIAGGLENAVRNNVVRGHPAAGILVTAQGSFLPFRNEVEGNDLSENGVDLAFAIAGRPDVMALGNCVRANRFTTSIPVDIEAVVGCKESNGPGPFATDSLPVVTPPAGLRFELVAPPPAQPNRPGAPSAAPVRVVAPTVPDVVALQVPK